MTAFHAMQWISPWAQQAHHRLDTIPVRCILFALYSYPTHCSFEIITCPVPILYRGLVAQVYTGLTSHAITKPVKAQSSL